MRKNFIIMDVLRYNRIKKVLLILALPAFFSGIPEQQTGERIISHAFELRYFSDDPKANGETDFKGETGVFDTDERISFLTRYAEYAERFFNDPGLDKKVVAENEVLETLKNIKPQPLPEVRKRIPLTSWKYLGYKPGQREAELEVLKKWNSYTGVEVNDGSLLFVKKNTRLVHPVDSQDWRMRMEWKAFVPASALPVNFLLGDACKAGIDEKGDLYYVTSGKTVKAGKSELNSWSEFIAEIDLETGRYNWYVNGKLLADFTELSGETSLVNDWIVQAGTGLQLDDIWGVSYRKTYDPEGDPNTRDVPFSIDTFIDEDFEVRPYVTDWQFTGYDDSLWKPVPRWPYAHGGERYKEEFLYMRSKVNIGTYEQAALRIETISPSGEVWINGEVVHVQHNQHPFEIDVSRFLKPDSENLIAVRVSPNKVEFTNRHTPDDIYTGWFTGRMWLEMTDKRRIKDIYVYTEKIQENAATLGIEIDLRNDHVLFPEERERKGSNTFKGQLSLELYKWFPAEEQIPAVKQNFPVSVYLGQDKKWKGNLVVPSPGLWTPENPQLYKLVARLIDNEGRVIDDNVVTTGIRTVSQDGGTFRINGEPAMMNGALSAAFRAPLDRISQWFRCGPEEKLVEELLMIKKLNGNTMRMTLNDGVTGNINDPRYAEIGDQLGIMFQWGTAAWVRTDSPYLIDFEGLPKYIRQVQNHPSIVMWQPANHPFIEGFDDAVLWMEKIYNSIIPHDRSRLISPTASSSQQRIKPPNDDGTIDFRGNPAKPQFIWTAPLITRGNMDFATGYGADWSTLRSYPYPKTWTGVQNWLETGYRTDYLSSKERAYFDFESEESMGQPNWNLRKGKPQYKVQSYEINYDVGSIGRKLTTDEWRESQAWQAMSGYEAYRKKRWLDYDGQTWCNLRGGHNTGTYQKPLIDYFGHAKLAFYAIRMVFQPVLAGSKNVDMVYGPKDKIPVAVMNLGREKKVTVEAIVRDMKMNEVFRKTWENVTLPEGRTYTDLPEFRPVVGNEGIYAVEYVVKE